MRNNRPLYWGQGQFLLPQHFQQQDLFHQNERQRCWRLAQPHGWGVEELRLREEGLAAGTLEVLRLQLVMRDGALIEVGSDAANANARLAPRSFEGLIDPAAKTQLSVYVALPRYRPQQSNLTDAPGEATGGRRTRYRLVNRPMPDLFDETMEPRDVGFLEYDLEILFDAEDAFAQADQSHELVKLAELAPAPTGAGAALVGDYIPPCLSISSSPQLLNWLKGLRDLLTAKVQSDDFVLAKRRVGAAGAGRELLRLLVLQTLSRYAPLFHHHLSAADLHPYEAYGLLRQIIGDVSVFSEEVSALGGATGREFETRLPPYRHDDLRSCFRPAVRILSRLLDELVAGPEQAVRLEFDGEYFAASIPRDFLAGERSRYYLMIESALQVGQLVPLLQQTGKISTRENMPQLRRAALFGLRIEHLSAPPAELPQRGPRVSYFAVDAQSPHWGAIRNAGDIAVFGQLDPKETAIKLLVVRPES
jgi:type VI secretion system protein ImpJ